MKELSIEQKAKRYDKALEKSKRLYEQGTITESLAYIFPELRESEDEKIRKDLIIYLRSILSNKKYGDKFIEGWIAWLEKQKPIGWSEEDSIICQEVIHVIDNCERFEQERNHENCVDFHHYQVLREWLKFLSNKYISQQPKQDEQKPTDKVEPKFHEGEWIISDTVNKDYHICKITSIKDGNYTIESIYGYKGYNQFDVFDNVYRLWTIQDAKDGDVLVASDKSLFIYDGSINENFSVGFHIAFTECMDIILNSDDGCGWEEKDSCHPATKEQRDTMMKAMADAGYTFDFEKKELKKIEQKPAWSEEDKEMLEDTCRILSNSKECTTSNVRWLKSLRPQSTWKPSGFHLECISDAIAMYQERGINAIGLKEILEELKKLKEE